MELTKSAWGMLVRRYRGVLKKCHLKNMLGAIVLTGALSLGAAGGVLGADVTMDQTVTGNVGITATDGNVILLEGVNNASGTIAATGGPSASAGNINAINAAGVSQTINQGAGNSLGLSATGGINGGAMTVNSANAGQDINLTGTLQTVTTDAQGRTTYGAIASGGNITAFDASAPSGEQGKDINVGNISAAGTIKAGDIATHGDLAAQRLETSKNTDKTIGSGSGGVEINGAINLSGTGENQTVTGRRLDIQNTRGSANSLGDATTGACISLLGNMQDVSTATAGNLNISGQYTQGWGMQAKINYIDNNTNSVSIRGGGPQATTLDLTTVNNGFGHLLADSHWGYGESILGIQNLAEDNDPASRKPGALDSHGSIVVGQNSIIGIGQGTNVDSLRNTLLAVTGFNAPRQDGIKAMLALNQPVRLNWGVKYLVGADGWENRPSKIHIDGDHFNIQFDWNNRTGSPRGDLWNLQKSIDAPDFFQGNKTLLVVNGDNKDVHYTRNANPGTANPVPGAISINHSSAPSAAEATSGTAEVQANAALLVTNTKIGENYVILGEGFNQDGIKIDPTAWTNANLLSDNPLVKLQREDLLNPASGLKGRIQAYLNSSANIFPGLDGELVNAIDNAAIAGQIGISAAARNTGAKGTQFLSRAVAMAAQAPYGANDAEGATATIEGAARMAVIGAVPQMALAANNAAGAAVTQRTSLANPAGSLNAIDAKGNLIANPDQKNGFALWIMPLYQSTNGFGMEAGNFDYDFSGALGGVTLGADWTFDNAIRAGILFNIGGGYARGTGDFNETTNDMNFWGIGAYAGWNKNGFGLAADVNFTSTYNELKQDLPEAMGWNELKGDVNAWALSAGLRAEYKFALDSIDIIPHVGARFINLNVDSYDITHSGTVIEGDSMTQNIWTFPVGVTFTKNIVTESGWRLKPLLDLNVTPAAGDIKAKSKIRFTGTGTEAEMDTKMMDYITYGGTVGLEFGKDNFSVGINYNGQFGAESSAHGIFGVLRYEF